AENGPLVHTPARVFVAADDPRVEMMGIERAAKRLHILSTFEVLLIPYPRIGNVQAPGPLCSLEEIGHVIRHIVGVEVSAPDPSWRPPSQRVQNDLGIAFPR